MLLFCCPELLFMVIVVAGVVLFFRICLRVKGLIIHCEVG